MTIKKLNRRSFAQKLGAFAGFFGFGSLVSNQASASNMAQGKFLHIVFFWLHEPESQKAKKQFENNLRSFIGGVDIIRSRHVGPPAGTPREVVDNSYTYCMVLSFDSKEDHDVYQDHALHKKFIEDTAPLWKKVQVYDSLA